MILKQEKVIKEWTDYNNQKWYRVQGSEDEWSLWESEL